MSVGLTEVMGLGVAISIIGVFAMLIRKNLILMLMGLEMIVLGAVLALAGGARYYSGNGTVGDGAIVVLLILVVAACEVAVGLALTLKLFKTHQSVWVDDITNND